MDIARSIIPRGGVQFTLLSDRDKRLIQQILVSASDLGDGMSIDKRQHERRDIQLKVVYRSITNLDDYTANISIGGCFLATQQAFSMGETIELALILPTGQSINATGIVRWISNDGEFPGGVYSSLYCPIETEE